MMQGAGENWGEEGPASKQRVKPFAALSVILDFNLISLTWNMNFEFTFSTN